MKTTASECYSCLLVFLIAVTLTGCQGVSNSSSPTSTPASDVTVALNQSSVNVGVGSTTQFTATVTGSSNTAVTWAVDGTAGGSSTVGTVGSTGLYTAPATAGTHSVTATSVAETSASAKASVTVGLLSLTPASASVTSSGTQQFTATLQGFSNTSVTWSVDNVSGGNSTVGTITASGMYAAPAQTGSHTITAVSAADTSVTASASIAVWTGSISPASVTLEGTTTQQFTSTIQGLSSANVTWTTTGGTVSSSGLYTAPASAGAYTVTATSTANSSVSLTATATVFSFTLSPQSSTVAPSAEQQFSAAITGISNGAVSWSVDGVAGGNTGDGTITSSGLYTAPAAPGKHTVTATSAAYPADSVSAPITVSNVSSSMAVLTYHNDDARDGAYLNETILTPQNVNSTSFGKLLSFPVDGQIYAQPLYLPAGGAVPQDMIFVATQNNSLYAFDADATASTAPLWQLSSSTLGPPVYKGDLYGPNPNIGILSTPVIDASTNYIYFVVETTRTGPDATPFFLYEVNAVTGAVINFVPINATDSGSGDVMGTDCYQRMGLALNPVTNWLYIALGSCSHGWVLAYDKATLDQEAVFDDTAGQNPGGGGFWSGGGAPAIDDATGNVFLMSGTDSGDQNDSKILYNDSFLNLNASTLAIQSYFAPDNNITLATNDADLGSGSPVLVPGNSSYPLEVIGGGKDGNVYVLDPTNMGGYSGSSNDVLQSIHTGVAQYDNIFATAVYWNGSIYYHPAQDVLRAFSWNAGATAGQQLSSAVTSQGSVVYGPVAHGAIASLSANGDINGIIWDVDNSNYQISGAGTSPSVLHAYDATDVATELYNSSQAGSRDTAGFALKFTVPTIAHGRVYVPTGNELDIYGLLP